MIINGKEIRDEILDKVRGEIQEKKLELSLGIIVVGEDPVIENFIKYKKQAAEIVGVEFLEFRFSGEEEDLQNKVIDKIIEISSSVNGIIVQLPLGGNIKTESILEHIPKELDVDVLSDNEIHFQDVLPPVTGAVYEILKKHNILLEDKNMLVVGNGKLVGAPSYAFFKDKVKNIELITSKTLEKEEKYLNADIIISGAGIPELINPEMVKEGVVLIDAGTSTQNKELIGDINYACEEKASLFSRTPNGVGPITIALIYKNLLNLYNKHLVDEK